jgi:hypothetical protein
MTNCPAAPRFVAAKLPLCVKTRKSQVSIITRHADLNPMVRVGPLAFRVARGPCAPSPLPSRSASKRGAASMFSRTSVGVPGVIVISAEFS